MTGPEDSELSAYAVHGFNPAGSNDSWSNLFLHVPPATRVLDVGCSSGNFGEALERLKGCTVVGVDLDAADVAEASTKISKALVFDITSAPSLDELGTFDVIVFADVLEHLGDPRGALARIRSILNEGGFALYSIPNMTHASVRFDLLRGEFGYTQTGILDKTHVHFYDRAEVDDVFASAGFGVVDENPVLFPYPDLLVRETLADLGLEVPAGSRGFFELLARTDGSVLQFVGKAVPLSVAVSAPDAAGAAPDAAGAAGAAPDAAGAVPDATEAVPGAGDAGVRPGLVREREFPPDEINRRVDELRSRVVAAETALNESQSRADAAEAALAATGSTVAAPSSLAAVTARADAERARADAERARADAAQAELDRLSRVIAELKHNPLRFAARRLRRNP